MLRLGRARVAQIGFEFDRLGGLAQLALRDLPERRALLLADEAARDDEAALAQFRDLRADRFRLQ